MIDTCEHYCTKVRHRLSRKDGKSSTETERKSNDSGKKRRSKEQRSEDSQSTSKELKMPTEDKVEPKKRSRSPDKQEAEESERNISNSPDSKRLKNDDDDEKHEIADVNDHSNAVAEMTAIEGKSKDVYVFEENFNEKSSNFKSKLTAFV